MALTEFMHNGIITLIFIKMFKKLYIRFTIYFLYKLSLFLYHSSCIIIYQQIEEQIPVVLDGNSFETQTKIIYCQLTKYLTTYKKSLKMLFSIA